MDFDDIWTTGVLNGDLSRIIKVLLIELTDEHHVSGPSSPGYISDFRIAPEPTGLPSTIWDFSPTSLQTAIMQEFIAVVMDRRPNLNSRRGFKKRNKILSHEKTPLSCWDMIRSIHLILPSVGSSSRNNNFVDSRLQIRSYILLVNSLLDEFIHHSISALVDITS